MTYYAHHKSGKGKSFSAPTKKRLITLLQREGKKIADYIIVHSAY